MNEKPLWGGVGLDGEEDSGEIVVVPPQDCIGQITVQRIIPALETYQQDFTHPEVPQVAGVEDPVDDILQDAKIYQDATIEYQNAYQTLKQKYSKQVCLMEEASGAFSAAESQASQKQQELLNLKKQCEVDIQLAVGKALEPYKEQFSSANHNLQVKDHAV